MLWSSLRSLGTLLPGGWQLGMAPRRRRRQGHMTTHDDTPPPQSLTSHRIASHHMDDPSISSRARRRLGGSPTNSLTSPDLNSTTLGVAICRSILQPLSFPDVVSVLLFLQRKACTVLPLGICLRSKLERACMNLPWICLILICCWMDIRCSDLVSTSVISSMHGMTRQQAKILHLSSSSPPPPWEHLSPSSLFSACCFALLLQVHGADAATLTVTNSCGYTVWPGLLSNAGAPQPSTTGFALAPGQSAAVAVAAAWSGRVWARTLCATSPAAFACATADCGSGAVECAGRAAAPPATLAELTLAGAGGGDDFYDVSLVDGFNVPMLVAPRAAAAANGSRCRPASCAADLNAACPAELRVAAGAPAVVACRSACEAFAAAQYCCSGAYGSPATCAPTPYSRFFKAACPSAYSYAYDDATSTFTCAAAGGYDVVFCPSASSLKSGGNPEAAGLPPSTTEFSGGAAGSLTARRDAVAALLQTLVVFSAMTWRWWW